MSPTDHYYTHQEIDRIHRNALAVPGRLYIRHDGQTFLGTVTKRLEKRGVVSVDNQKVNPLTGNIDLPPDAPFTETDPAFTAWLALPPALSLFVNDLGFITSLAHVHGIANALGVQQFTFGVGDNIRIEGAGGITITFDVATKKITITGGGGGGEDLEATLILGNDANLQDIHNLSNLYYSGILSHAIGNRVLYDTAGIASINYRTRQLLDGAGITVLFDWQNFQFPSLAGGGSRWVVVDNSGNISALVISTGNVPEGANLYFTQARVLSTLLTGFAIGANITIDATDSVLSAFGKTQAQIDAKENAIAPGTVAQYWRGDKTWVLLDKNAVGLGNVTNDAQVTLTGNQTIDDVKTFTSFPITPSAEPSADYEVANKKYVDDNKGYYFDNHYKVGVVLSASDLMPSTTAAGNKSANIIYFFPFTPKRNISIDQLMWQLNSSGVDYRMGLWDRNASTKLPDTLINQSGSVAVGSAGVKTWVVSANLNRGQMYYASLLFNSATSVFNLAANAPVLGLNPAAFNQFITGYSAPFAFGAMPADTSTLTLSEFITTPASTTTHPILFGWRISALL